MDAKRRDFLKAAAGITALSQTRVLGANETIRVGGIGTGGRGSYILDLVRKSGGARIVALCDVYSPRLEAAQLKLAPDARLYSDYKELLAASDIDAVVIGSPDHWHATMVMDAVRAGKDVYCEKPVTHTIEEGDLLIKTVVDSGKIVQVGYQQRSWDHFKLAKEIIDSGRLGHISLILTSWYQDYLSRANVMPEIERDKLDWRKFLGNAPEQPFDPIRFSRWRWFWDFGGGHLTDLYSHLGDVVQWYMNAYTPKAVQTMGSRDALPMFQCPETINAAYEYSGFNVVYNGTLVGSLEGAHIIFRGSHAMMSLTRDGFTVYQEHVIPGEKTNYPDPTITVRSTADGTPAHVKNFLDCVRDRKQPNAAIQTSVAAARAAHLGNLAYRKGTRWERS
jgi:predicted dehydrogenase